MTTSDTTTADGLDPRDCLPSIPPATSSSPSVLFLTMYKAGSVVANYIFSELLRAEGLAHIDLARHAFGMGIIEDGYCVKYAHLFKNNGYYFGAFCGNYCSKFPDLSENKIIIQVRDPRDCIVSLFYSYLSSHPEPGDGELNDIFQDIRRNVKTRSIDEFALSEVGNYAIQMNVLRKMLSSYPNCVLLSYEDMVTDTDGWINKTCQFLGIQPSQETLSAVYKLADFNVTAEDPQVHRRQVTPGDFRRKLKLETQAAITAELAEQLAFFGYQP